MGKKGKRSNGKTVGKKKNEDDVSEEEDRPASNNKKGSKGNKNDDKKSKKKKERKGKGSTKDDCDDDKFRASLQGDGRYSIIEIDADGNCLFRSISDQLFHDYGKKHHTDVRSAVCGYMEEHEDDFSVFLVLDENEEDEDAADFASYIKTMREDGTWGGNLELVAAARLYRRNITVFSANANMSAMSISHGEDSSSGPDLLVSYHDNDHYSSVRDNEAITPFQPFEIDISTSQTGRVNKSSRVKKKKGKNKKASNHPVDGSKEGSVEESKGESIEDGGSKKSNGVSITEVSPTEHSTEETTNDPKPEQVPVPGDDELKKKTLRGPRKNAPCPCGSGDKYKKCCWAQERHDARLKKMNAVPEETREPKDEILEMNGNFRVLQI